MKGANMIGEQAASRSLAVEPGSLNPWPRQPVPPRALLDQAWGEAPSQYRTVVQQPQTMNFRAIKNRSRTGLAGAKHSSQCYVEKLFIFGKTSLSACFGYFAVFGCGFAALRFRVFAVINHQPAAFPARAQNRSQKGPKRAKSCQKGPSGQILWL